MQVLLEKIMNSLYGVQIRRDIDEFCKCKSQHWIETEFDDNILDYWKLANGNYISKMKKDDGLDGNNDDNNTLSSHLGAFTLSNSKRFMNNFIREMNGFHNISINHTDTDSLYIERKNWDVSEKASFNGPNLSQVKKDYKSGGTLYGLFLAPKIKNCLNYNEFVFIEEHKSFKGFNDSKRLLDRSQ